jgi:hypothetical protein
MNKNRELEHEFERKFATWRVAQAKQELLSFPKRAQLDVLTRVALRRLVKEFGEDRDGGALPESQGIHRLSRCRGKSKPSCLGFSARSATNELFATANSRQQALRQPVAPAA